MMCSVFENERAQALVDQRGRRAFVRQQAAERAYAHYCADQVVLAVYHKRPLCEIQMLLERQRLAISHEC